MHLSRAAILAVALVAACVWGGGVAHSGDGGEALRADKLARVRTWHYQLQRVDLDSLRSSEADLLVIDYARARPPRPLLREEVDSLKRKPDGSPRVVLAYLSIGEAESYRYYWQDDWQQSPPSWLVGENCEWRKNYLVRFWDTAWSNIVIGGSQSYLGRVQDAGFDGVYLDRVDAYQPLQRERTDARAAMIEFVKQLAATAREREPGFLVFPQNADTLLADRDYREVIDGIGRESLVLHGNDPGMRNPELVRRSVDRLKLLSTSGKPVLVVEYPRSEDDKRTATAELAQHGFVYKFAHRSLDGRDPLAAAAVAQPLRLAQTAQAAQPPIPAMNSSEPRPCLNY